MLTSVARFRTDQVRPSDLIRSQPFAPDNNETPKYLKTPCSVSGGPFGSGVALNPCHSAEIAYNIVKTRVDCCRSQTLSVCPFGGLSPSVASLSKRSTVWTVSSWCASRENKAIRSCASVPPHSFFVACRFADYPLINFCTKDGTDIFCCRSLVIQISACRQFSQPAANDFSSSIPSPHVRY
jgi:hypothetical protein